MNSAQVYLYFQLLTTTTALLYPCQYIDASERIYKCDLCQCLSSPTSFCPLKLPSTCANQTNEESTRSKLKELTRPSAQLIGQIEFHNFNDEIRNHPQICSLSNFSQLTFFHSTFYQLPECLSAVSTLRFAHSVIQTNTFSSERLIFFNTTFHLVTLNITSTKMLTLHSVQFSSKPFPIKSSVTLTHLTIAHTEDIHLFGSFPQLSYLNLDHTNLTDKQLNKIFSQTVIPDLTVLILSNNHLTTLTNRFPSTIRYLDLSRNQIKSLDYYSFKSLYSLNILNLSHNSPLEIQQDTFTRIPYLEILDLSYSSPTLPFDDLFLPLQKLRHLNISANYLDTLPHLPIPHDAHTIESYDQHLPVLYVDLSHNHFEKLDLEIFSSPSTQDKYILSLNMTFNQIKTLKFSSGLLNDTKRRGPFIELDVTNNPLECDCDLYESINQLLQNTTPRAKQSAANAPRVLQPTPTTDLYPTNRLYYIRARRQQNLPSATPTLIRQTRLKILRLFNLTCLDLIDPTLHRPLSNLSPLNSVCSYTKSCPSTCSCCSSPVLSNDCYCYSQCPAQCSCKHSFDLTNNYINCSNGRMQQIPPDLPPSTTHLYLNNNEIKSINPNLTYLIHLKFLSLANNSLQHLSNDHFAAMKRMESLDLSSNRITTIQSKAFSHLLNLKRLYLHNNPWLPNFYHQNNIFHANVRLDHLTYSHGLSCHRLLISSVIANERPLTAEDCCAHASTESCERNFRVDRYNLKHEAHSPYSRTFLLLFFHQKYIFVGLVLLLFVLVCIIAFYMNRKKRRFVAKEKLLANNDIEQPTNHYHTKVPKSIAKYDQQINDRSISFTDEDEYASIPLTTSQTDLSSMLVSQVIVPPLPPRRHFPPNRPVSHSSTTSTSITIPSMKSPNSSSLATNHSCLQIKLDVLVLYSITDSGFIHENLGQELENTYGKRFSFYFIHRDRMLGELDWLIENSCVTILILRKPYHLLHDYMKILSAYSAMKCFIILINHDPNHRLVSIKAREKIARLYRTSDIYEWSSDPDSLIHEQLELFLEQNCGSATYVPD